MPTSYDLETKERVVRLFNQRRAEESCETQAATLRRLHELTGIPVETMRGWVIKARKDSGDDPGLSSFEREEIKALRKELAEAKRAHEIPKTASAFFRGRGARPPTQAIVAYIDAYKHKFGAFA